MDGYGGRSKMSSSALSNVNFGTVVAATASPPSTNPNSPTRYSSSVSVPASTATIKTTTPTRVIIPGQAIPSSVTTTPSRMQQQQQEEDVLKDVLDELDRERSRRAELEATVRTLQFQLSQQQQQQQNNNNNRNTTGSTDVGSDNQQQKQLNQNKGGVVQQQQQQQQPTAATPIPVTSEVIARIEAQVRGYQELLNAVTVSKPAIGAAADAEREEFQNNLRDNRFLHPADNTSSRRTTTTPSRQSRRVPTLPLNVVRYLEIIPWDSKCSNWIYVTDYVYEWQVYVDGKWQTQIRYFPLHFKQLPFVRPRSEQEKEILSRKLSFIPSTMRASGTIDSIFTANASSTTISNTRTQNDHTNPSGSSNNNRSFLHFLAGGENVQHSTSLNNKDSTIDNNNMFLGGKHATHTNEDITILYSMENGYPIPQQDGGVWEWVGPWKINNKLTLGNNKNIICDSDGWSYTNNCFNFLGNDDDQNYHNVFNNPYEIDNEGDDDSEVIDDDHHHGIQPGKEETTKQQQSPPKVVKNPIRRRQWNRLRVLVDYHLSCESTKEYLKVLYDNAKLSYAVGKVSDQLTMTRTLLNETEHKLEQTNIVNTKQESQIKSLTKELESYKRRADENGTSIVSDNPVLDAIKGDTFLKLKEFVATNNADSLMEMGMELSNRGKETVRELSSRGKESVKDLVASKLSAESMKDFGSIITSTVVNHSVISNSVNNNTKIQSTNTSASTNSQNAEQLKDLGFKISQWVSRKLGDGDHQVSSVATPVTASPTATTTKTIIMEPTIQEKESTVESDIALKKPPSTDSSSAASTTPSITTASAVTNDSHDHPHLEDITHSIPDDMAEEIIFSDDGDILDDTGVDLLPAVAHNQTHDTPSMLPNTTTTASAVLQSTPVVAPQRQQQSSLLPDRFDWMSIGSSSFMNRIKGSTIPNSTTATVPTMTKIGTGTTTAVTNNSNDANPKPSDFDVTGFVRNADTPSSGSNVY